MVAVNIRSWRVFWSLNHIDVEGAYQVNEQLDQMCKIVDPTLHIMILSMKIKYEKYWLDLSKIKILLYVAIVLKPRYKINGMMYGLESISGKGWSNQLV